MIAYKRSFSIGKPIYYLVGFLFFLIACEVSVALLKQSKESSKVILSAEKQLDRLVITTYKVDKQIITSLQKSQGTYDWNKLDSFLKDIPQAVVIRKNDTLIYWNHSDWPDRLSRNKIISKPIVQSFPSGWFLVYQHKVNGLTVGIFSKLQSNFPIHNEFLSDSYTKLFSLAGKAQLTTIPTSTGAERIGSYGVGLKMDQSVPDSGRSFEILLCFFLSYFFLLLFLWSVYGWLDARTNGNYKRRLSLALLFDIIVLRVLDYSFGFPVYVKQLSFFQQVINGMAGFNSWGDLVLNMFILLIVLFTLRDMVESLQLPKKYRLLWGILISFFLLLIPYLFYALADNVLSSNSEANLLLNTFFSLSGLKDLLFIFVLNGLIYLWIQNLVIITKKSQLSYGQLVIMLFAAVLVVVLLFHLELELVILATSVALAITTLIWFLTFRNSPYLFTVGILFILSVAGAFLFNLTKMETKNAHQRLTSELLAQKNDPYLEFRFHKLSHEILSDTLLLNLLKRTPVIKEQSLDDYLNTKYFNHYFEKYSRQITLCEPGQQLVIQPDNKVIACETYFSQLATKKVFSSADFSLSLVNDAQESLYYLAKFHFKIGSDSADALNLYVEFFADFLPKGLGYPELLIDAKQNNLHLSGYSFARYTNGMLQYKFGDFLYPVDFTYFKNHQADQFFFKDGYRHLIHFRGSNDLLIVSRSKATLSQGLLPFSLLFLFSGFLLIIFISIIYGRYLRQLFHYSLRARLQLIFFSSVLIIFILLSAVTLYYFNEANHARIESELKEKAHSVLIELQHKLASYNDIRTRNNAEVESYLQKFSMVFFSDINLYDPTGKLIASSRPEIFKKSLQSSWMNPGAYYRIHLKHQLFYLSRERIGKLVFYSSYMPFTLENGQDAGIINLPFFARQSEIQHSYYQMLANLVNLFVITGMLGFVFILFLSKLLTKPLKILQAKIKSVSIDRINEKIEWEDDDEIGQLIRAYNQMVEKLEHSAELLKMSEREKAWREMAQQIAHEIRNPLTPMKLNVQYLERTYQQGDAKFDERLKNISQSLISQIDTLNEVAGMFSDFSKTGLQQNIITDLMLPLQSAISLFKKSYKVDFVMETPLEQSILVKASEQDLLRIFTNLIKNAIQAMEGLAIRPVKIKVYRNEKAWMVEFSDKGKGINPKNISRIFQPYFTTKSTGTGLGLAIVKNMMRELGGEVSFVSEQGKGSVFTLKFQAGD